LEVLIFLKFIITNSQMFFKIIENSIVEKFYNIIEGSMLRHNSIYI